MLAARVEQKNGMTKDDKNGVMPLDKESPIQAVCPNWARTDLCGGREVTRVPTANSLDFEAATSAFDPIRTWA